MTGAVLALLLLAAAADPAEEAEAAETTEAADPADERVEAAPPGDPSDLAPQAAPALPVPDKPRARALDAVPLAGLQCLTGCAVMVAAVPAGLICTTATCLGFPFLVGYFETWVGDAFGPDRAPAIVPVLTAYAGTAIAGVAGLGAYGLAWSAGTQPELAGGIAVGTGAVFLALTAAAIPIAYQLSAVPKHELDDGSETPGILEPRLPLEVRQRQQ